MQDLDEVMARREEAYESRTGSEPRSMASGTRRTRRGRAETKGALRMVPKSFDPPLS